MSKTFQELTEFHKKSRFVKKLYGKQGKCIKLISLNIFDFGVDHPAAIPIIRKRNICIKMRIHPSEEPLE